jgi:putative endonuclease
MRTREIGAIGEAIALQHYRQMGFSLVQKNLRFKRGEIDLILRQQRMLLFVEVKFRAKDWQFGADQLHWGKKLGSFKRCISVYLAGEGRFYEEYRVEIAYVTQGRVVETYQVN